MCSYVFAFSLYITGAVHIYSRCHPGGVSVWGDGHPSKRVRPGLQRDAEGGFSEQLFTATRGVPGLCQQYKIIYCFIISPQVLDCEISLVQNPTRLYIYTLVLAVSHCEAVSQSVVADKLLVTWNVLHDTSVRDSCLTQRLYSPFFNISLFANWNMLYSQCWTEMFRDHVINEHHLFGNKFSQYLTLFSYIPNKGYSIIIILLEAVFAA